MRIWPCFIILVACHEPRVPRSQGPYSLHLLGAGDGALRGHLGSAGIVFTGRLGHDYAIQIANDGPIDIGVSMLVDGLDAATGAPTASCEHLCSWGVPASGEGVVRGFEVDSETMATYRFTRPEDALAALTKGARREAIGTIEACFFSVRAAPPSATDKRFRGMLEKAPPPGAIVSEVRPRASTTCDRLLDRVVIGIRSEDGSPLGTAPPPAGIARVVRPPPPLPQEPEEPIPPRPPKGVKPPKRQKPPK